MADQEANDKTRFDPTGTGLTSIQFANLVNELTRIFVDRVEMTQRIPNLPAPLRMLAAAVLQGGVPFYDSQTGVVSWQPLPDIANDEALIPDFSITFIDGTQIPQVSPGNKTLTFQTVIFSCVNNSISTKTGNPIIMNLSDPCKT